MHDVTVRHRAVDARSSPAFVQSAVYPFNNKMTTPSSFQHAWDAILDALVSACRSHYGSRLRSVAVFGSVGRGTMRGDSDIDLLLLAEPLPNGRIPRIDEFAPVEAAVAPVIGRARDAGIDTRVSAIIRTPAEARAGSPLMFDMTEDARILYDPDVVLGTALDDLKARLNRLGARRIHMGGWWYWDLKPDFKPGEVFDI